MGVMPKTRLVLVRGNVIIADCSSYQEAASVAGVTIDDSGQIYVAGQKYYPNYILKHHENGGISGFTKQEAITDWFRCYHAQISGLSVLRYLV